MCRSSKAVEYPDDYEEPDPPGAYSFLPEPIGGSDEEEGLAYEDHSTPLRMRR